MVVADTAVSFAVRCARGEGDLRDRVRWKVSPPRWALVSGILCATKAASREESQRWSRHVPKRRSTATTIRGSRRHAESESSSCRGQERRLRARFSLRESDRRYWLAATVISTHLRDVAD